MYYTGRTGEPYKASTHVHTYNDVHIHIHTHTHIHIHIHIQTYIHVYEFDLQDFSQGIPGTTIYIGPRMCVIKDGDGC
jgi:hypothetical protein